MYYVGTRWMKDHSYNMNALWPFAFQGCDGSNSPLGVYIHLVEHCVSKKPSRDAWHLELQGVLQEVLVPDKTWKYIVVQPINTKTIQPIHLIIIDVTSSNCVDTNIHMNSTTINMYSISCVCVTHCSFSHLQNISWLNTSDPSLIPHASQLQSCPNVHLMTLCHFSPPARWGSLDFNKDATPPSPPPPVLLC